MSYRATQGSCIERPTGYSDSTIRAMLGRAGGTIASRHVHHLDRVLIAAADRAAVWVAEGHEAFVNYI